MIATIATVWSPTSTAQDDSWSLGLYAGRYYDTEPAGFVQGKANFLDQNMLAITAKKTLWSSPSLPYSIELDAMVGIQGGIATLGEVAIAPALRWHGFPWQDTLRTSVSIAPLGISYTTKVSPLELGRDGKGSQWLNWLFLEVAASSPRANSVEYFARLHHRCAVYDLLNNYGANGEDFLTFGIRRRF
ncbi:MAG: hypothetical protein ACOVOD_12615 [Rhodoferax sp.]